MMIKIYRIVDNTNGNIYIGKTELTLTERLSKHKYDYKIGKNCSSCIILKNGDYDIELIEETDDESRERYHILNTDCVNVTIPGRTRKEYYEDNIEETKKYKKVWYKNNYDKVKEYKKELYKYQKLWGDSNNNLLKIDTNLFLI
tara:strand:+ start:88 stop:519 length:432 start_codon:yes stop_codon:yes gene_type:complete